MMNQGVRRYLGNGLQEGLWVFRYVAEDVQVCSVHVLSAGQQNRDLPGNSTGRQLGL